MVLLNADDADFADFFANRFVTIITDLNAVETVCTVSTTLEMN